MGEQCRPETSLGTERRWSYRNTRERIVQEEIWMSGAWSGVKCAIAQTGLVLTRRVKGSWGIVDGPDPSEET